MKRRVGILAVALLLAGCTFPTITPPSPATQLEIGGIEISQTPGAAVDRPTFDDPGVAPAGVVDAPAGEGLTGYLGQPLTWTDCGELQCAQVVVPLDYANPQKQAVTLSLARRPATVEPRLGTLFVNPGGPGAGGTGLARRFAREGLEQYDIVGWDPRGTGGSTPVRCFGGAQADGFNNLDSSPDDQTEREALLKGSYEFAKACWERNGTLLEHISTIETVRDLDLLRQLLGDPKLHYFGYSYGTEIGATYAELFPFNTGRLVLDSPVNIVEDQEVIQAMGFELALHHFAAWCASENCVLGQSEDEVIGAITSLLDGLDARPLAVQGRVLTQTQARTGVLNLLYSGTRTWPTLVAYIDWARSGSGEALLWAADQQNGRGDNGRYSTIYFAFEAIRCLDGVDEGVLSSDEEWTDAATKAPIFGRLSGPDYLCSLWPVRPAPQLTLRGVGAEPILVVGSTGDSATPYQYAQGMVEQLDSAVLLTYDGEGHSTYGGKSPCIDAAVIAYLVNGSLPTANLVCPA